MFLKKKSKIIISGNPKFELSKKKNCNIIFSEEIKKIKEEFGSNYYFFSSSFSNDLYGGNKLWNYHTKKIYKFDDSSIKKKEFDFYHNNDEKNYLALIELAIQTAKAFPKKKIIFRPHPTQDINLVKKRFPKSLHNLHIVYKFHSTPWIFNCEYFFHSHCSTSFEAFILKKKIIQFYKTKLTRHLEYFNNFSKAGQYKNYNEVIKKIKRENFTFSKNEKKSLKTYSLNSSKNSHKIIANAINQKFKNIKSKIIFNELNYQNDSYFVIFLKKILVFLKHFSQKTGLIYILDYFFDLKPNFFLNKIIKDAKGSELNKYEIDGYLKKTNKIYKSIVKSEKVDKNIFLISRKK
ncbi:MAG: hypothetical protein CMI90_01595 [Pelagibacteraceae bacterium]|nr:hypothetical protein [Pelagibacteraceae bacterium]